MSNLGWYQIMTTAAKKCGGPKNFMGLLVVGGMFIGGALIEGYEAWKKRETKKQQAIELSKIYNICKEGVSNEGLQFHVGDTFKVLERDGNAVLIEKIGDSNNPYFVDFDFLKEISDYKLSIQ